MPLTEAGVPGTDDWYLMGLANDMGANFPRLGRLRRYREGDAPMPDEADPGMRAAYRKFIAMARLNMCELIVNAKANRQKVVGFRTAAVDDVYGDKAAWATWKRSHMAVGSRQLFADAGHYGRAFLTVYGTQIPGSDGTLEEPIMVPSNEWTTWTRQDPMRPWAAEAAIQIGYDSSLGVDRIILYRPGYMRVAERVSPKSTIPTDGSQWKPNPDYNWVTGPVSLGYTEEVPVVQYATLTGKGFYEPHLDTVDRINDIVKQRLTIVAMQAFRQRALKGDLPTEYPEGHDKAGEPIDYNEIFKAGPAALWLIPETAEIWESQPTDITAILTAAKDDLKNLAAVTATPLYVLSPDAASGSAEGAALARETLVFSVEELNDIGSDTFALAHSLAFQAARDQTKADASQIETIYASIDRANIGDRASAASQAKAGGLPQRFIDEKVFGLTPAEIEQAAQDREDEAFAAAQAFTAAQASAANTRGTEYDDATKAKATAAATTPATDKTATPAAA